MLGPQGSTEWGIYSPGASLTLFCSRIVHKQNRTAYTLMAFQLGMLFLRSFMVLCVLVARSRVGCAAGFLCPAASQFLC